MTIRQLLNSPEKWTQKSYARNNNGVPVDSRSRDAVCWCLVGAMDRVYGDVKQPEIARKLVGAFIELGYLPKPNRVGKHSDCLVVLNDCYDWPIINNVLDVAGV